MKRFFPSDLALLGSGPPVAGSFNNSQSGVNGEKMMGRRTHIAVTDTF